MSDFKLSDIIIKGKWYNNNTALVLENPKNNEKQILRTDKPILDILKNKE